MKMKIMNVKGKFFFREISLSKICNLDIKRVKAGDSGSLSNDLVIPSLSGCISNWAMIIIVLGLIHYYIVSCIKNIPVHAKSRAEYESAIVGQPTSILIKIKGKKKPIKVNDKLFCAHCHCHATCW